MRDKNFWAEKLEINGLAEDGKLEVNSRKYVLKNKILRERSIYTATQSQTKKAFGFKWSKRETYESKPMQNFIRRWLVEKYTGGNSALFDKWLPPGTRLLDAGCGSGLSSLLLFKKQLKTVHYLGVDISEAVDVAVKRFGENNLKAEFMQADITHLPFSKPIFDVIFSEGVLHHADHPEKTFKYLARLINPGGRFIFYVYRKKTPIREFNDDYIRDYLKDFTEREAWVKLMPLTKLGKVLGDLKIKIDVPEAIPFLGVPAGKINLQRLFYWHIFKIFYNKDLDVDEMNHVNFDWYRPLNCHRYTPEEVMSWCRKAGLTVERLNVEISGISVVALKNKNK